MQTLGQPLKKVFKKRSIIDILSILINIVDILRKERKCNQEIAQWKPQKAEKV